MSGDLNQVRYAEREELMDVAIFLDKCWRTEYRQIIVDDYLDAMSVDARYERLLSRYDEGMSDFFVMFDDGCMVGAAVFGKSFTDGYESDGEISAIYLHRDYIGKGYGHRLFTEAERALAEKGYAYIVLDLLAGNARALGFYLAHGYEVVANVFVSLKIAQKRQKTG